MTEALTPLGRVVATERKPNTPHEFHFWTALDSPVGIGTIVRVEGRTPVGGRLPQVYGVVPDEAGRHLRGARELSLSFLHWLQTEAPRPDGGVGYPGLRLRGDLLGTSDGLAKRPYIRESRRLRALYTVVEQDLALDLRPDGKAARYDDSVGVGSYRIDLHPSTGGDPYVDIASCPFEIPLRALVPVRVENLLPAAKNIGTTHITNGCYRLHPVEWNIGEVAGHLAASCLDDGRTPHEIHAKSALLEQFQGLLTAEGIELRWPDGVTGY